MAREWLVKSTTKIMARCTLKEGADVQEVRRTMQKRGYTLRAYKQADGTVKYTLRKKSYHYKTKEK